MNGEKPLYRPVSVQDATEYHPTNGTQRVKRVNFVMHDGTTSQVSVPIHEYDAEHVKAALDEAAAKHQEVMSIKGPPAPAP